LESLEKAIAESHISRKTSEMWGTRDLFKPNENPKKRPQISPQRYAPVPRRAGAGEMTILFEGRIPSFHETSADLQIPRLRSG
jgi:hypothetical protein